MTIHKALLIQCHIFKKMAHQSAQKRQIDLYKPSSLLEDPLDGVAP